MDTKPFYQFDIGDLDLNNEKITAIYCATEDYLLYEIKKNGIVNRIVRSSIDDNVKNISKLNPLIIRFDDYMSSKRKRRKYAQKLATAIANCLDNNVKQAELLLNSVIVTLENEKITKNKIVYLLSCVAIVMTNIVICCTIQRLDLLNNKLASLFLLATFGSFGGLISVSLKINKLDFELFYNQYLQIWIAISRISIAMISSLIVYVLIKSNLVFGFIEETGNIFVHYSISVLAGFSEYYIPDLLGSITKKSNSELPVNSTLNNL